MTRSDPAMEYANGYRRPMPKRSSIVAAQSALLARLGACADAPLSTCWRCKMPTLGTLDRAHIHAHRDGGSLAPENFWLLCPRCHSVQPDDAPFDVQIEWLTRFDDAAAFLSDAEDTLPAKLAAMRAAVDAKAKRVADEARAKSERMTARTMRVAENAVRRASEHIGGATRRGELDRLPRLRREQAKALATLARLRGAS